MLCDCCDLRPLQQLPDHADGRELAGRGDWEFDQHHRDQRTIERLRSEVRRLKARLAKSDG